MQVFASAVDLGRPAPWRPAVIHRPSHWRRRLSTRFQATGDLAVPRNIRLRHESNDCFPATRFRVVSRPMRLFR
ncbi:hypothetical protein C4K40_5864 [Pseudomonas sp. CMR5c]|nr:hypothetical protein C4K40_5864 [Pseudomonas sp. CMR5c]